MAKCPACKGTGIDPAAHSRYTSGGRDDRSCSLCYGECELSVERERTKEATLTPEERAAHTIRAMQDAFGSQETYHPCLADDLGDAFEDVRRFVAAAIREAVAAEREECAKLAETYFTMGHGGDGAHADAKGDRAGDS